MLKVQCVKFGDFEEETDMWADFRSDHSLAPSSKFASGLLWPVNTNVDTSSTFFFVDMTLAFTLILKGTVRQLDCPDQAEIRQCKMADKSIHWF